MRAFFIENISKHFLRIKKKILPLNQQKRQRHENSNQNFRSFNAHLQRSCINILKTIFKTKTTNFMKTQNSTSFKLALITTYTILAGAFAALVVFVFSLNLQDLA